MVPSTEVPQGLWGQFHAIQVQLAGSHVADNAADEALTALLADVAASTLGVGDVRRRFLSLHRNRRRKHAIHIFLARRQAGYPVRRRPGVRRSSHEEARASWREPTINIDVDRLADRVRHLIPAEDWSLLLSLAHDLPVADVADQHGMTSVAVKTRVSRTRRRLRESALGQSIRDAFID
jgi:hypothetical protein